jgi:hypothetical protein
MRLAKQTEMLSTAEVERWYPGGISGFHGRPEKPSLVRPVNGMNGVSARPPNCCNAGNPCTLGCRCGPSCTTATHSGSLQRPTAAAPPCASRRSAFLSLERFGPVTSGSYEYPVPTYGGPIAVCAAAAVAGAVSATVDGRSDAEALTVAIGTDTKAKSPEPRGKRPRLRRPFRRYSDLAKRKWAVNVGGDSDSVASIGGAIAGPLHPQRVYQQWFKVVRLINEDDLVNMATSFAAIRRHD